jgi:hypothetical protein
MNNRDSAKKYERPLNINRYLYAYNGTFIFLSEGSIVITIFARFGLTVHLSTKERNSVVSKTKAMHIADLSAAEDYDVRENHTFISFAFHFDIL